MLVLVRRGRDGWGSGGGRGRDCDGVRGVRGVVVCAYIGTAWDCGVRGVRGRTRGVIEGVRGVLGNGGWRMRVVGEWGGEVGSVERESDEEDAELDTVAYTQ